MNKQYLGGLAVCIRIFIIYLNHPQVKVGGSVHNSGWTVESIDKDSSELPEEVRIRGFKIVKNEQVQQFYGEPGKFSLKP